MRRSLLSTLVFVLFSAALYAQPSGWQYNLPILVQNPGAEAYNYQMAVYVNTQDPINAGQMQANGGDIRFGTPCTGDKMYNFYIDSAMNSTSTRIFVLLDTLKHGNNYIYMFYGNPVATSASTLSTFDGPYHPYANAPTNTYFNGVATFYFNSGDTVINSTTSSDVQEGFVFTANQDMLVTELGDYVPSNGSINVSLINYDQFSIMDQASITGPGDNFNYSSITQPRWLYQNNTYGLSDYIPSGTNYYRQGDIQTIGLSPDINVSAFIDDHNTTPNSVPQQNPILYFDINNPYPTVPYNSNTAFDGYATMTYYKLHKISPVPSYTIGEANSGGIVGQPQNDTVCVNSNTQFTALSTGLNPTYQWQVKQGNNWVNITPSNIYSGTMTATLNLTNVPVTLDGKQYRVHVMSSCGEGYSDAGKLTVVTTPPAIPTATLLGPNPACEYINSVYHVYTNMVGGTYAWNLNGNVVSTTDTFDFHPNNGDVLYCTVTAPMNGARGCYTVPEAVTSQMVITTGNNLVPLDSIGANRNNVCEGTVVNYKAYSNVQNGTYAWTVNGVAMGGNSSTLTYAPTNGDIVQNVIHTPSNGCWALTDVNSQQLVASVTPAIQPLINIYGPAMITPGQQVTVHADVVNAGSAYYILWFNNGVRFDSTVVPYTTYTKTATIDNISAVLHGSDADVSACYGVGTSNSLTIGWQTGVQNVGQMPVQVYPNPFSNQISVTGLKAGDKICIYDIMGRKVSQDWEATSSIQTLSVQSLSAGTYFVHVFDEYGNTKANVTVKKI